MAEPFVGEIRMVAFNFAPRGFSLCDGNLLTISDNQNLFSLLGTTFGGNGTTTFGLPDLRGRAPVHRSSNMLVGTKGGNERITLSPDQMPAHTHLLHVSSTGGTSTTPAGEVPAVANDNQNLYADPVSTSTRLHPTGYQGGGQSHDNMQPSLTINFVIALTGMYPSRN